MTDLSKMYAAMDRDHRKDMARVQSLKHSRAAIREFLDGCPDLTVQARGTLLDAAEDLMVEIERLEARWN